MKGCYDLHLHIGPEVIPRRYDAIQAGESLRREKMGGAVLKSHYFSTVPFAKMAWERGFGNVWGSVVLNHYVGGLNPFAIRASLGMEDGAGRKLLKIVWMPTVHAAAHLSAQQKDGSRYDIPPEWTGGVVTGTPVEQVQPINVTDPSLRPALDEILRILAGEGLILATGHLSREEVLFLVPLAKSRGVEKVILTHPAYETTRLTVEDICQLTALGGVYAEQSYALMPIDGLPLGEIVAYIRGVGAGASILSTDLGQRGRPSSGEGMQHFLSLLEQEGIPAADLETMAADNPARLLGV